MSNEEHATGPRPERLERKLAAILHAEVEQEEDGRWSAWIEALSGCAPGGSVDRTVSRELCSDRCL